MRIGKLRKDQYKEQYIISHGSSESSLSVKSEK